MKSGLALLGIASFTVAFVATLAQMAIFRTIGMAMDPEVAMTLGLIVGVLSNVAMWVGGVSLGLAVMARDDRSPTPRPGQAPPPGAGPYAQ